METEALALPEGESGWWVDSPMLSGESKGLLCSKTSMCVLCKLVDSKFLSGETELHRISLRAETKLGRLS